jgi:hypothetical protein
MSNLWDKLSGKDSIIIRTASIAVAIIAIVNVYEFYRKNIWTPTIMLVDVDYDNAVANLVINGKNFTLRGDSKYLISYDYGISFGTTNTKNGISYDRIELLKRYMVKTVLHKKGE